MKFPFVLRNKYEIAKNNYKNSQEHRKELQRRYIVLQQKIIELENEIKELKKPEREPELLKRCIKCNKYFTTPKSSKRTICMDCKNKKKENV